MRDVQVTGRSCARCEEKLVSATGGEGCAACDLVFHRKCLEVPTVCPECSTPFAEAERAVEREAMQARGVTDAGARRGTVRILAGLLSFDVAAVLFVLSSREVAKPSDYLMFFGNLIVASALAYATYRRLNWARWLYGILMSLSGAGLFAAGLLDPRGVNSTFFLLGLWRMVPAALLLIADAPRRWTVR
jgi:hypothetical protein